MPFFVIGIALAGCDNLDLDLRNTVGGFDTSSAARSATAERPAPDERGLISYPNYDVVVAQRGDTVAVVANRIGIDPGQLASYNGLRPEDTLNNGEVLAIPPSGALSPTAADGQIDVTSIATTAIDSAGRQDMRRAQASTPIDGPEPIRHQVARGETAYTISRLYNVSVRSLADWNGLGPDLAVRQGQYLLIPVTRTAELAAEAIIESPGSGSVTPVPPSASKPLPEQIVREPVPPAPGQPAATAQVADSGGALLRPVSGKVLRPYKKKSNEGIDIASPAGTAVQAAAAGEVAAITRDTDQVPILVLRHPDNLLTVYANISDISVKKGARVQRGQSIAKVAPGDPSFVHFEVRQGFESVDPEKFLK
ncbi:MAG: LysM peptidoglycan-binding domain-containing M23 family metallopeptidase [Litoreibacter sp.]|nr:LysM peptidoglycan-binding domain-containing M23 family metallopeptidase [Litoreibacter sp.]